MSVRSLLLAARAGVYAVLFGGGLALAVEPPAVDLVVSRPTLVAHLTGPGSLNETASRWGVHGTDLGHTFWHRGELYMVFGDTFAADQTNWRSNVMARIASVEPARGLRFDAMITGPDGMAKELIPSRKIDGVEMTVIPTYGVSVGERMILHYMSVQHWAGGNEWRVNHSGLAYSDDDGASWTVDPDAVWPGGESFAQVAMVRDAGWVQMLGIPQGRSGGIKLRRVPEAAVLEKAAYEYWNGKAWVADEKAAAIIVPGPVGELSVLWSEAHRRWLMMYLNGPKRSIVLRTAAELTGPWSDEQVVVTASEYPQLYGPFMLPLEVERDLYFTMSVYGPYNVLLMHATLGEPPAQKAPGEMLPAEKPALQQATKDAAEPEA